jgi:hypothetical protein
MRRLVMGLTIMAMVACAPVALALWTRDRLRVRNRVQTYPREVRTRHITLICYVPRQSSRWGRA